MFEPFFGSTPKTKDNPEGIMEGIYYTNVDGTWGDGVPKDQVVVLNFEMHYNDWLIARESKEFQNFLEHLKFCTAYRYSPEVTLDELYKVRETNEYGRLHSVKVSFSLASHDWSILKGLKVFHELVSYLWELQTRDIRREIR